ncbi:hypothetical protein FQR65_LT09697 [Abscondita terminalis]|nr:hypothetical protein FQR65_LT09697 [Abscondita terminalis]
MKYFLCILIVGVTVGLGVSYDYVKSSEQFSSQIYQEVVKKVVVKNSQQNFIVSPASAQLTLSLLSLGAKGRTAFELDNVLALPVDPIEIKTLAQKTANYFKKSESFQFLSENQIFTDQSVSIKKSFQKDTKDIYQSDVQSLSFSNKRRSARIINDWVEQRTGNIAENIINEQNFGQDTKIVVVNAVQFKPRWQTPFYVIGPKIFTTGNGRSFYSSHIQASDFFNYYYNEELDAQFVEIPFDANDVVLTIVVPQNVSGLCNLEKSIEIVLSEQPYHRRYTYVRIPKFRIETTVNFATLLPLLGARTPFSQSANFGKITGQKICLNKVLQKGLIQVCETKDGNNKLDLLPSSFTHEVIADRPFIYYLRHKELGILLVGRYVQSSFV